MEKETARTERDTESSWYGMHEKTKNAQEERKRQREGKERRRDVRKRKEQADRT